MSIAYWQKEDGVVKVAKVDLGDLAAAAGQVVAAAMVKIALVVTVVQVTVAEVALVVVVAKEARGEWEGLAAMVVGVMI